MKISFKKRLAFYLILLAMDIGNQSTLHAQTSFWQSGQAFLGQQPPLDMPEIFAPGLLADSGIVLGRVAFSNDGKEFYYGFARHWFDFNGTGIKQIRFNAGKWEKPVVIMKDMSTPTLSTDGQKMFVGGKGSAVFLSEKKNGRWTNPVRWLDKPYGLYNFMPAASGVYYVGSNGLAGSKKDYSSYDFCTLTINGRDTVIKSLGSPLNTQGFDGDLYIAPDESYIIISAKETPSFECELWISFRKKDASWTAPVSLGDNINKGLAHRFGQYVSPDGRYLFFTKGTSEKDCNIYWVRFDSLLNNLKAASLRE